MWGHSPSLGEAMVTVAEGAQAGALQGSEGHVVLAARWMLCLDSGDRPALVAEDRLVQLASLSAPWPSWG